MLNPPTLIIKLHNGREYWYFESPVDYTIAVLGQW